MYDKVEDGETHLKYDQTPGEWGYKHEYEGTMDVGTHKYKYNWWLDEYIYKHGHNSTEAIQTHLKYKSLHILTPVLMETSHDDKGYIALLKLPVKYGPPYKEYEIEIR